MAASSVTGIGHGSAMEQNITKHLDLLGQRSLTKDDLKRSLEEYKNFAFAGSIVNTCLAFALGAAGGKIINALVNNVIMPVVNWGVNSTGTDWRTLIWTPIKGMKLELGSFIGASIDFFIVTLVCFVVWKIAKRYASQVDPFKAPTTT